MTWLIACFAIGFVSFVLWAAVGTYLSTTLRSYWPDLYALAGSPTTADFWWRRTFPNSFDQFTLSRQFRRAGIANSDLLLQFEVAFWSRWLGVVAFAAVAVMLLMQVFGAYQP